MHFYSLGQWVTSPTLLKIPVPFIHFPLLIQAKTEQPLPALLCFFFAQLSPTSTGQVSEAGAGKPPEPSDPFPSLLIYNCLDNYHCLNDNDLALIYVDQIIIIHYCILITLF